MAEAQPSKKKDNVAVMPMAGASNNCPILLRRVSCACTQGIH